MAEVNWTQESQTWLKDIYDYIAADNLDAAAQTVSGIFQRAQLLRQHPESGYKYETGSLREVRILLYGHYRITYLIKADRNIDILGVFHGALDIDRYLV
ncbi:MAG TPA: type II toxin-antitoxin system RelE/ParE family toxin [Pyrinomonadaceae bacterium]|nr:type II toxin-antitoxin system RelE/ParE family toxin [Pyrinomonadaceae bacterium]